jgi:signal recognition particle GTPase
VGKMSEKEEDNVIDFSKSQMRRIAKQTGRDIEDITDEDFKVFMEALFGPYKGSGYNPE